MKPTRPAIVVAIHEAIRDAQLTQLLLGIEEEGVPVELQRHSELNPLELAHHAAVSSQVGIGCGISLDYVVITTEKLPKERPYIVGHLNQSAHADRIVGSNAARIVKRIPLRADALERSQ